MENTERLKDAVLELSASMFANAEGMREAAEKVRDMLVPDFQCCTEGEEKCPVHSEECSQESKVKKDNIRTLDERYQIARRKTDDCLKNASTIVFEVIDAERKEVQALVEDILTKLENRDLSLAGLTARCFELAEQISEVQQRANENADRANTFSRLLGDEQWKVTRLQEEKRVLRKTVDESQNNLRRARLDIKELRYRIDEQSKGV